MEKFFINQARIVRGYAERWIYVGIIASFVLGGLVGILTGSASAL